MSTITKKLIHVFLTLSMLAYCAALPAMAAETNRDAYQPIPAVSAEYIFHSNNNGDHIGNNNVQSILRYDNVDFGTDAGKMLTALYFEIALDGAGGTIDVYMDSTDAADPTAIRNSGKKLAAIKTDTTGSWSAWEVQSSADIFISKVTGIHTLYVMFNSSHCGNVKSFYFGQSDVAETAKWTLDQDIPAVKYDDISVSVNNGTNIGNNNGSGYIRYDGVDFGQDKLWKELAVEVGVSNDIVTRKLSVYILNDDTAPAATRQEIVDNGTEIASIVTTPTGDWNQYAWQYSKTVTPDITGIHSVYILFTDNYTGNLKTLRFSTVRKIDAFHKIEAESADEVNNCNIDGDKIGATNHGSWAKFTDIDFSTGIPNYFIVKASSPNGYANGTVELYTDDPEKPENLVASIRLKETADWNIYSKNYVAIDQEAKAKLTGTQIIYLKFIRGDGPVLGNVDNFQFAEKFNDAYAKPLYGEDASDWHENLSKGNGTYNDETHAKFGSTGSGRWILYENVDFGQFPVKEFSMIYGAPEQSSDDGKAMAKINVYLDNTSGTAVYSDLAENTGGYNAFRECGPYALTSEITGLHDVYITFGYSGTCDFMGIAFTSSVDGLVVMENTLSLADIYGNELINGQILTSNVDFIEASCTIANNAQTDASAVIILAVYTPDGRLARVAATEETFAKGTITPDFNTYIDFPDGEAGNVIDDTTGYMIKAMVWNGLEEGMAPLPGGSL